MRAVLLVIFGAIGCGFTPSIASDGGGDGSGPPGDRDGDGILDPDDNCPDMANQDQRDHDDDHHGDVCDRCPHLASVDDPDGDGDGVGDACDPRPALPGDSIALWDGFYDDSTAGTWTQYGGTWTLGGGKLHETETQTIAISGPMTTFQHAYATTSFTLTDPSHSYTVIFMSQVFTVDPLVAVYTGAVSNSQSYSCSITSTTGTRVIAQSQIAGQRHSASSAWAAAYDVGHTYRMTETTAAENHCEFLQDTLAGSEDEPMLGPMAGTVGLYVAASAADFDYLFVVETGS